jgi:hypothetical protein
MKMILVFVFVVLFVGPLVVLGEIVNPLSNDALMILLGTSFVGFLGLLAIVIPIINRG